MDNTSWGAPWEPMWEHNCVVFGHNTGVLWADSSSILGHSLQAAGIVGETEGSMEAVDAWKNMGNRIRKNQECVSFFRRKRSSRITCMFTQCIRLS